MKVLRDSGDEELASVEMPESIFISVEVFEEFLEQIKNLNDIIKSDPDEIERCFSPMNFLLT